MTHKFMIFSFLLLTKSQFFKIDGIIIDYKDYVIIMCKDTKNSPISYGCILVSCDMTVEARDLIQYHVTDCNVM